jgi:hypothetical protein
MPDIIFAGAVYADNAINRQLAAEHEIWAEHARQGLYDTERESSTMAEWERRAHRYAATQGTFALEATVALHKRVGGIVIDRFRS